jgi:hypothetical protein
MARTNATIQQQQRERVDSYGGDTSEGTRGWREGKGGRGGGGRGRLGLRMGVVGDEG